MNNNYQLNKVVVLSRHGIRTPLLNTLEFLSEVTPYSWLKWDHPFGYLTTRGGTLESYFGHYFSQWLENHHIKLSTDNSELFVYANSLQRTVATAQFFIAGAYAGQDIVIHHKYPIEKMDSIFDPSLRLDSAEFKQKVTEDINKADETESIFKNLAPSFELLSDILDYKQSNLYAKYQCELADIPTELYLKKDEEPALLGSLAIGASAADALLLQYYSGFPKEQIAWGKINSNEQWQQIINIRNQYVNLICQTKTLAKHAAAELITMIDNLMQQEHHKVNLLVGHDSNIASLLSALNFKHYQLPSQFETTPIGGKVIFQRFRHQISGQYFFKAEYVYPSFEQLHYGQALSLLNPPQHVQLELENATTNSDGFYNWTDFEKRLNVTQP
ncbi:histidine-type phosphatase [Gilliamella sp. wkB108]|uniref:histidine-type phosphatase n=1 Tax=Gilliamella sp. wkB108 TaxID=3120256 RepID=UPI0009C07BB7|nr:histidine-type phosphatase [Gilliamella apicola]